MKRIGSLILTMLVILPAVLAGCNRGSETNTSTAPPTAGGAAGGGTAAGQQAPPPAKIGPPQ